VTKNPFQPELYFFYLGRAKQWNKCVLPEFSPISEKIQVPGLNERLAQLGSLKPPRHLNVRVYSAFFVAGLLISLL
jgi:hypothetical protein